MNTDISVYHGSNVRNSIGSFGCSSEKKTKQVNGMDFMIRSVELYDNGSVKKGLRRMFFEKTTN